MTFPPVEEQLALIRRGIEKIVPEEELAARLRRSRETGTPLRIKYGIDPTGIDVHLGHTVPLRKIRQFQELGHQAVIIIGNYTALVGDPSGRDEARKKRLTPEDVEQNARDYLQQIGKVIDLSRAEVVHNGDWFGSMTFAELLRLCGQVTVAQLLTRDDFAKRYASETPIFLHECLYPVMQAFDSVVIAADVELGGTEQLYSFMLARDLQKDPGICDLATRWMPDTARSRRDSRGALPQQIGVMSPILVGTDGTRRMGKSLGNYIGIGEAPYDMMKKFMQLPDAVMRMYFELLTSLPVAEIEALLTGHPKEAKLTLGKLVIGDYHAGALAEESAARWQREISEKALPDQIESITIQRASLPTADWRERPDGVTTIAALRLLLLSGLVKTNSDARRAISQGGAYFGADRQPLHAFDQQVELQPGLLVWVGKKRVIRVNLET